MYVTYLKNGNNMILIECVQSAFLNLLLSGTQNTPADFIQELHRKKENKYPLTSISTIWMMCSQ